jgi:hypothetical protein
MRKYLFDQIIRELVATLMTTTEGCSALWLHEEMGLRARRVAMHGPWPGTRAAWLLAVTQPDQGQLHQGGKITVLQEG